MVLMHVTTIVVEDADAEVQAAAQIVAAILGPARLSARGASLEDWITVGRPPSAPDVQVRPASSRHELTFFERVPRLRDALGSVDLAALTEACIGICRARQVARSAPPEAVRARIDEHLRANNVCALTSGPTVGFRTIPIEYDWDGTTLAFMSEGGEKFARMVLQPEVSLALADRYTGFATLRGTQVTGNARLLEEGDPRVLAMVTRKGISREQIAALPCRMNFFLVEPTRIEHIDAEAAKAAGYDARQVIFTQGS